MYDRLVHFAFGLLLAYPMREVFLRVAKTRGIWGYWFRRWPSRPSTKSSKGGWHPGWHPPRAWLSLGAQGDIWDAQKDMLLATTGAMATMLVVALLHWRYDPGFGADLRASLKIEHGDTPLGEDALRQMLKSRRGGSA